MPIDGHRSDFPNRLDDWGDAFQNNQCQRFHASRMNKIEDATYALERHTRRVLLTGESNSLRTDTGDDRPKLLAKSFVVTLTGGQTEYKTAELPAFTTEELQFFDGAPLAAENNIHLSVRKIRESSNEKGAFVAGLKAPITEDGVGQYLTFAPLRDSTANTNLKIAAGDYIVTLIITR